MCRFSAVPKFNVRIIPFCRVPWAVELLPPWPRPVHEDVMSRVPDRVRRRGLGRVRDKSPYMSHPAKTLSSPLEVLLMNMKLLLGLALVVVAASSSTAANAQVDALFSRDGLSGLKVNGHEVLADATPKIIVASSSDQSRDRNAEDRDQMYQRDDRDRQSLSKSILDTRFDPKRSTLQQAYEWGVLSFRYVAEGNQLNVQIRVENRSDRVIETMRINLMRLQLPMDKRPSPDRVHNVDALPLLVAPFEEGQLLLTVEGHEKPLKVALDVFAKTGTQAVYVEAWPNPGAAGSEVFDGVWLDRPIRPGESDEYSINLIFADEEADPLELAADAVDEFRQAYPPMLRWHDRRPITSIFVADRHRSTPTNPRGWAHAGGTYHDRDVTTPQGIAEYREQLLGAADRIVDLSRKNGVQGVIVWNIEGEQYGDSVYYGEPQILDRVAPEMSELADELFARLRKGGLRVGVCLRPTEVWPVKGEGSVERVPWEEMDRLAHRNWYPGAGPLVDRLDHELSYAKERWGAELFYVDTNHLWRPRERQGDQVDAWSAKLIAAAVFEELQRRHPDVLIIPEFESPRYYASTMPYSDVRVNAWRTKPAVRAAYPDAATVVAVAEVKRVQDSESFMVEVVREGDILLTAGWYPGEHLDFIRNVYRQAAEQAPFTVQVARSGLTLNGKAMADAQAVRDTLTQRLEASLPIPDRSVVLRFASDTDPAQLDLIEKAVCDSPAILLWSTPDADLKTPELP